MPLMNEKVVITGMGTVNSLGLSVNESWKNAIAGQSGVGPITLFNPDDLRVQIACEVKDYDPLSLLSQKEARRRDRVEQFATLAAREAVAQSGLDVDEAESHRIGVFISSAIGGLETYSEIFYTIENKGPTRVSPFSIPMIMSNGSTSLVALDFGYRGPSFSISSACASSNDAIGMASLLIRSGVIDAAITGGAEATITKFGIATFDRLGALSRRNEDFSITPQPFDLNRDGLVMGEGAGVVILEREDYARKRGALILGGDGRVCCNCRRFPRYSSFRGWIRGRISDEQCNGIGRSCA